jgi:hypothetical protein
MTTREHKLTSMPVGTHVKKQEADPLHLQAALTGEVEQTLSGIVPWSEPDLEDERSALPGRVIEVNKIPDDVPMPDDAAEADELNDGVPEMVPISLNTGVAAGRSVSTPAVATAADRTLPPFDFSGRHYVGWQKGGHSNIRCAMLESPRVVADLSALERYGISLALLEDAINENEEAAFELGVGLLELVITKRNAPPHPVRRYQHIPDSVVNEALVRAATRSLCMPLVEVLRFQLNAVGRTAHGSRAQSARQRAVILCSIYGKERLRLTRMARLLGVAVSTVSRWMKNSAFDEEMERFLRKAHHTGLGEISSRTQASAPIDLSRADVEQLWERYRHFFY